MDNPFLTVLFLKFTVTFFTQLSLMLCLKVRSLLHVSYQRSSKAVTLSFAFHSPMDISAFCFIVQDCAEPKNHLQNLAEILVIKKKIIKPEYFHKGTFLALNFSAATDIERNLHKFINSHQSA